VERLDFAPKARRRGASTVLSDTASEAVRRYSFRVAGEPVTGGSPLEVLSPFDGTLVATVPTVGAESAKVAIESAAEAMRTPLTAFQRADVLERASALLRDRREHFAGLLVQEAGKPVAQALVETDRAVQTLAFSAVEARTLAGRGIAVDAHPAGIGRRGFTIRVPIGVIGAITPFNFPLNLAVHKIAPAIAAGCSVVAKPSRSTPLSTIELAELLYECGLPPEWLSVLVGPASDIVDVMIADPRVAMITFTGSSDVGWDLATRAPRKRVSLELGNSTPVIVCADGDLAAAAAAVATSAFGFAGQSCISVQRVIVDARVHDEFATMLAEVTRVKVVGDPLDRSTDIGPLIDAGSRDRVERWIDEATDAGATALVHGSRVGPCGLSPTILDAVDPAAQVWRREVFGPVVSLRSFEDLETAFEMANETEYGLQAGVYTKSLDTAFRAAERLEFGGVTINETPSFRVDQMPYGGIKESGNTKEGPHFTVREMTEERMVLFGG
jgi:acyl-CoA reductase-like NAD-dependent aldehyde dehydrogenase